MARPQSACLPAQQWRLWQNGCRRRFVLNQRTVQVGVNYRVSCSVPLCNLSRLGITLQPLVKP